MAHHWFRSVSFALVLASTVAACSSSSDTPTTSDGGASPSGNGGSATSSAGGQAGPGSGGASGGGTGGAASGGANRGGPNGAGGNGPPSGAGGQSAPGGGGGGASDGGASSAGGTSSGGSAGSGGNAGAGACPAPTPGSKGTNPLFTDQFTADPAPFVHDCTFYVQCGHDAAAAGQNGFVMREWFLLASTDLVHWTRTVALRLGDFKWASANAWAGQMVTKNGKFFWYVPVQEASTGAMAIGVAVADNPRGPFTDAIGQPLINDAFEMSNVGYANPSATPFTIDPTVFVDDDGQAYLHYGGFGRMHQARLGDDMISISGKMQQVPLQGFFEAPFLTKRDGTYYEIYAAGANPAAIDYATSPSPLGPWTRRGRVLDPFTAGAGQDAPTNHAGVARFGNDWYLVYHVSNGPNGGGTYRREVALDKLTFNADGTIMKVIPTSGLSF